MDASLPVNLELGGHFAPAEERRYRHVPFQVPAGVRQLHIEISYNDRTGSSQLTRGGNTLDVGLFDEAGIEAGSSGFRGWSGSERVAITIDETWATPPYRGGGLGAGIWHLLLGAYKVGTRGLTYQISVRFDQSVPENVPRIVRTGPTKRPGISAAAEPGWYRGDLHTHSVYSDGDSWPSELMIEAANRGLDFLAITDHNGAIRATRPDGEVGPLPLLVPGIEVTTYRGHWNVWGVDGWFDFRTTNSDEVRTEMHRAAAAGGLLSINHPKPWGPEWEYEGGHHEVHAMEIWNGPFERLNLFALLEWEEQLMKGIRLVAVGGSDAHYLRSSRTEGPIRDAQIGEPTTWVQIDGALSIESLLAGIRAGNCFVSNSLDGPQLYFRREDKRVTVRVVGAKNTQVQIVTAGEVIMRFDVSTPDWSTSFLFPEGVSYIRSQVLDVTGRHLAISNPIWANFN